MPVLVLSLVSAIEILILKQTVTGAVRNFIVVSIISFAAFFSCSKWLTRKMAFIITILGMIAAVQAFIPDFLVPVAAFAVFIAVYSSSPYLGISCLVLFCSIPFLVTERSYEYFLFYMVTGLLAIALIYGRRKTGKYNDVLTVFALVYILLYIGLIIMKRAGLTPWLIVDPVLMLIFDIIIMGITGYRYYMNVVKSEEDLYLDVVDPEFPLLLKLKSLNKNEYKRAIHTAHYTELFAEKFGYDRVLLKGLGFYHRIGVLLEDDDTSLTMRTVALALEQGFPDDIIDALKQYGEAAPGKKVSAEVSITIIVDTVIISLMNEYAKGNDNIDLNKFIDRTILGLFSGRNAMLKQSAIPYSDLEEIRRHLKGEGIYYGFLR